MVCSSSKYPLVWDLSCFYDSVDSPKIKEDKESLLLRTDSFVSKYVDGLSVSDLPDAVYEYEEICKAAARLRTYVTLYYQTRLKDSLAVSAYQGIIEWWGNVSSKLCKFIVEMQKLDYAAVEQKLKEDPIFSQYSAFIEEVFRFRDHTLLANEESIVAKMEVIAGNAWHKFHEGILSRIEFQLRGEKLTLSDVVEKSNHGGDESLRKEASLALSEGLKHNEYALVSIFNNIVLSHKIHGEIKRYKTPEDQRFLSDNIPNSSVEHMVSAITESYEKICHRYYKLKARILNRNKLQYWDRCSSVKLYNSPDKTYSYDDAIDLILSIFKNFSNKFYEIAHEMVTQSWVDVLPKEGKVSGAFACSAVVDLHPFVLLNFYGSIRDVLTIAHEFGHGIHQRLSMKNSELVCNPGLNISETASIFAEKLTNEYLLANEEDQKRKIELICSRLDDVMSTVFRQVAFFKFEQKIHEIRKYKELTSADLDMAWRNVLEESLGDGVELDHCIDNFWGYITHFTSSPFYVYSYAFGCLFVEGLFTKYKESGDDFIAKYEEALSSGGTKSYAEIASMFGIDADSKQFWRSTLESIEREVDGLEALCDLALCN